MHALAASRRHDLRSTAVGSGSDAHRFDDQMSPCPELLLVELQVVYNLAGTRRSATTACRAILITRPHCPTAKANKVHHTSTPRAATAAAGRARDATFGSRRPTAEEAARTTLSCRTHLSSHRPRILDLLRESRIGRVRLRARLCSGLPPVPPRRVRGSSTTSNSDGELAWMVSRSFNVMLPTRSASDSKECMPCKCGGNAVPGAQDSPSRLQRPAATRKAGQDSARTELTMTNVSSKHAHTTQTQPHEFSQYSFSTNPRLLAAATMTRPLPPEARLHVRKQ